MKRFPATLNCSNFILVTLASFITKKQLPFKIYNQSIKKTFQSIHKKFPLPTIVFSTAFDPLLDSIINVTPFLPF